MKKLIFVLAIALMAAPVLALDVYLENAGSGVINVKYSGADANNLPRAFALELTIDGTGTFDSFVTSSYIQGESATGNIGYGIYPAAIDINTANGVDDWGTPLAATGDPGAGSGFGSQDIVLEFGSLYVGDGNAPATSGTLCSLNVTAGTATQIVLVEEETYRGGVVLEDGTLADVNDVLAMETAPGVAVIVSPADAGTVALSTTLTWTVGAGTSTQDIYFGTTNPPALVSSDAASSVTTYATGTMANAATYYWRIDEKNGAGTTTGTVWSFSTECYYGMTDYAQWVEAGKPACWCYPRQCKGDADGGKQGDTKTGYYYVGPADLTTLIGAWQVKNSPKGPGVTGTQACADFDHLKQGDTKTGYYRVGPGDLTILTAYWQVKESPKGPGVSPTCLPGNMNP